MIAVILCLILTKQAKEISVLLSMVVCTLLSFVIADLLSPVVDLFRSLEEIGQLDSSMIRIILKAVGISILGEISGAICVDSGLSAPGKGLKILCSTVILWMSVPLFQSLIQLLEEILICL